MPARFERPPKASHHCRHYSYKLPISAAESGPTCAKGLDLSEPCSSAVCMPDPGRAPFCPCAQREEYTDAERAAWKAATEERMARLVRAIAALPAPIPLRTSGSVACPNCGGELRYARWHRGAEIGCSTEYCCGGRFSIEAGKDWPSVK